MKLLHRTFDRIDVPARARVSVTPDFRVALLTGALAIIWFGVVGSIGNVHAGALHARLIAFGGAALFLVLAALAVRSAGNEMHRVLSPRVGPSHASVVRLIITVAGLSIAILATLGLLAVPVQHLLLGGELAGTVTGMGLTYVTLDTPDGLLSVPNSVLLNAGIGPQPAPAANFDLNQHLQHLG